MLCHPVGIIGDDNFCSSRLSDSVIVEASTLILHGTLDSKAAKPGVAIDLGIQAAGVIPSTSDLHHVIQDSELIDELGLKPLG